jgi:hypothetical protein
MIYTLKLCGEDKELSPTCGREVKKYNSEKKRGVELPNTGVGTLPRPRTPARDKHNSLTLHCIIDVTYLAFSFEAASSNRVEIGMIRDGLEGNCKVN